MPKRIQRSRKKGARLPKGAVCVSRGTKYGNQFRVGAPHPVHGGPITRHEAVELHRQWLGTTTAGAKVVDEARRELRGKDLACWCGDGPCHRSEEHTSE